MIKELYDLPAKVIGFEVTGKVLAQDFLDVVLPAFERASKDGEFRAVVVIPNFGGMSGGALWEDLRLGVPHLRDWKRISGCDGHRLDSPSDAAVWLDVARGSECLLLR